MFFPFSLHISIAESNGAAGSGFDWMNKVTVLLNVKQLGDILSFDLDKSKNELKLISDTKLAARELVIKRLNDGYFFNVTAKPVMTDGDTLKSDGAQNTSVRRMSIGITEGEFRVIITLFQQAIPALIGFNFQHIARPTLMKRNEDMESSSSSDVLTE